MNDERIPAQLQLAAMALRACNAPESADVCVYAADRIAALEARCHQVEADRAVIMDESIEQAGRIAELEATLRELVVAGESPAGISSREVAKRCREVLAEPLMAGIEAALRGLGYESETKDE